MLEDNIYQIFSVVSNARLKEIEKNSSKIKAFNQIKKEISLPFDNDFFGKISRNDRDLKKDKNKSNSYSEGLLGVYDQYK